MNRNLLSVSASTAASPGAQRNSFSGSAIFSPRPSTFQSSFDHVRVTHGDGDTPTRISRSNVGHFEGLAPSAPSIGDFNGYVLHTPVSDGDLRPPAPTNVSAFCQNGVLTISWDNSSGEMFRVDECVDRDFFEATTVYKGSGSSATIETAGKSLMYYRVLALNAYGASDPYAFALNLGSNALPSAPREFCALATGNQLRLSWAAPASGEVVDYVVEEGVDDAFSKITIISESPATEVKVPLDTSKNAQYLRVRARSAAGFGPAVSAAVSYRHKKVLDVQVAIEGDSVPESPEDFQVKNGKDTIELRWTAPVRDGGKPILKYRVDASATQRFDDATTLYEGTNLSVETAMLDLGAIRFYRVVAYNALGASDPLIIRVQGCGGGRGAPGPLAGVRTSQLPNGNILLSWDQPSSEGSSPIDYYQLLKSDSRSFRNATMLCEENRTSYEISGLEPNTTVFFRVAAHNSSGFGPGTVQPFEIRSVLIDEVACLPSPMGKRVPSEPTHFESMPLNAAGGLRLSWRAPANSGASDIIAYKLEQATSATFEDASLVVEELSTSVDLLEMKNTGRTYFRVTPRNAHGYGAALVASVRLGGVATKVGFLLKKGGGKGKARNFIKGGRRNWKRRLFVLTDRTLTYYASIQDFGVQDSLGELDLSLGYLDNVRAGECNQPCAFAIRFADRDFLLAAENATALAEWQADLSRVCADKNVILGLANSADFVPGSGVHKHERSRFVEPSSAAESIFARGASIDNLPVVRTPKAAASSAAPESIFARGASTANLPVVSSPAASSGYDEARQMSEDLSLSFEEPSDLPDLVFTGHRHIERKGWMYKKGGGKGKERVLLRGGRRNWKLRFFVLGGRFLSYYKDAEEFHAGNYLGALDLSACTLDTHVSLLESQQENVFALRFVGRDFLLSTSSLADMQEWLKLILTKVGSSNTPAQLLSPSNKGYTGKRVPVFKLPEGSQPGAEPGTWKLPAGSYQFPDGTTHCPDGSVRLPEGSFRVPDAPDAHAPSSKLTLRKFKVPMGSLPGATPGSWILPNGNWELPSNATHLPDGSVQFPEGTYIGPNMELPIFDTKPIERLSKFKFTGSSGVELEGILHKKGGGKGKERVLNRGGRRNWKKRYFVLGGQYLTYFQSKEAHELGHYLGALDLTKCWIDTVKSSESTHQFSFALRFADRDFLLAAESFSDFHNWTKLIQPRTVTQTIALAATEAGWTGSSLAAHVEKFKLPVGSYQLPNAAENVWVIDGKYESQLPKGTTALESGQWTLPAGSWKAPTFSIPADWTLQPDGSWQTPDASIQWPGKPGWQPPSWAFPSFPFSFSSGKMRLPMGSYQLPGWDSNTWMLPEGQWDLYSLPKGSTTRADGSVTLPAGSWKAPKFAIPANWEPMGEGSFKAPDGSIQTPGKPGWTPPSWSLPKFGGFGSSAWRLPDWSYRLPGADVNTWKLPEGAHSLPEGSVNLPNGQVQFPPGSWKAPKVGVPSDWSANADGSFSAPDGSIQWPGKKGWSPPSIGAHKFGSGGSWRLPEGSYQMPNADANTWTLPDGDVELPNGAVRLPDGQVRLPAGSWKAPKFKIPSDWTRLPDGSFKAPNGSIQWPSKPDFSPPSWSFPKFGFGGSSTWHLPDFSFQLPGAEANTWKLPEGDHNLPEGAVKLPDGQVRLPEGSWKAPKAGIPADWELQADGSFKAPDGSIQWPGKPGWSMPSFSRPSFGFGGASKWRLPDGSYQLPEADANTWTLPPGDFDLPAGSIQLKNGQVRLPAGTWKAPKFTIPSSWVALPDGSFKAPDGSIQWPGMPGWSPPKAPSFHAPSMGGRKLSLGSASAEGARATLNVDAAGGVGGGLPSAKAWRLPDYSYQLPGADANTWVLPEGDHDLPAGAGKLPNGQVRLPSGSWKAPKVGVPSDWVLLPDGKFQAPDGSIHFPGKHGFKMPSFSLPKFGGFGGHKVFKLPDWSFQFPGADANTWKLPEGEHSLPEGAMQLPDGQVRFPDGSWSAPRVKVPKNWVAMPDGSFKAPDGSIQWPGKKDWSPPTLMPTRFQLPVGSYQPPGADNDTWKLPAGCNLDLPDGAIALPGGVYRFPHNSWKRPTFLIPSNWEELPDGSFKAPDGSIQWPGRPDWTPPAWALGNQRKWRLPNGSYRLPSESDANTWTLPEGFVDVPGGTARLDNGRFKFLENSWLPPKFEIPSDWQLQADGSWKAPDGSIQWPGLPGWKIPSFAMKLGFGRWRLPTGSYQLPGAPTNSWMLPAGDWDLPAGTATQPDGQVVFPPDSWKAPKFTIPSNWERQADGSWKAPDGSIQWPGRPDWHIPSWMSLGFGFKHFDLPNGSYQKPNAEADVWVLPPTSEWDGELPAGSAVLEGRTVRFAPHTYKAPHFTIPADWSANGDGSFTDAKGDVHWPTRAGTRRFSVGRPHFGKWNLPAGSVPGFEAGTWALPQGDWDVPHGSTINADGSWTFPTGSFNPPELPEASSAPHAAELEFHGHAEVQWQGYLLKKGGGKGKERLWTKGGRRNWSRRWFVLGSGFLSYYQDAAEFKTGRYKGVLDLSKCYLDSVPPEESSQRFAFALRFVDRDFLIAAENAGELKSWSARLKENSADKKTVLGFSLGSSGWKSRLSVTDDADFRRAELKQDVNCKCDGDGLRTAVCGKEAKFTCKTFTLSGDAIPVGGCAITGSITAPSGKSHPVLVKDLNDGSYECSYTTTEAGLTTIHLHANGVPVKGGPYTTLASPGDVVAIMCVASGPGVEQAFAHKPTSFDIFAFDAYGNPTPTTATKPFVVTITSEGGPNVESAAIPKSNCTEVQYTPSGYDVNISVLYDGAHIKSSPLKVKTVPGPDPNACIISNFGPAMERLPWQTTVQLAQTNGQRFPTGGADLKFSVRFGNRALPVDQVTDNGDGSSTLVFTPPSHGKVLIDVSLFGAPIPRSPFTLNVERGPSALATKASGVGVVGPVTAGVDAAFTVTLADSTGKAVKVGGAALTATVASPAGDTVAVPVTDVGQGKYSAAWLPELAGVYTVDVKLEGTSLAEGPYTVDCVAGPAYGGPSIASGNGLTGAVKKKQSLFFIQAKDQYGNNCTKGGAKFVCELTGGGEVVPCTVVDTLDGSYTVTYTVSGLSDVYTLDVSLGGVAPIFLSPFQVELLPAPHAPNCRAVGQGLQGGMEGVRGHFSVYVAARDGRSIECGGHDVRASVKPPFGDEKPCDVLDAQDGSYQLSYLPTMSGPHQVRVFVYFDEEIAGSPFDVSIAAGPDPLASVAHGPGTQAATAGVAATFTITTNDCNGQAVYVGGQEVTVKVSKDDSVSVLLGSVTDNNNGTYDVVYTPERSGTNMLDVQMAGVSLRMCPIPVLVAPNAAYAPRCHAVGEGLRHAFNSTHLVQTFVVHTVDEFGNPCTTGGAHVAAVLSGQGQYLACTVVDQHDGSYACSYSTSGQAGVFELAVSVDDNYIHESPFTTHVTQVPCATQSKVYGPGVEVARALVGTVAHFDVQLCNPDGTPHAHKSGHTVNVSVEGVDGEHITTTVESLGAGLFHCTYQPEAAGVHHVHVNLWDVPVAASPYRVEIMDATAHTTSTASGDGLRYAYAKCGSSFTIQARNILGEPLSTGGDAFEVEIVLLKTGQKAKNVSLTDNEDGTYTCTYVVNVAGVFVVNVTLLAQHISDSPFPLTVGKDEAKLRAAFAKYDTSGDSKIELTEFCMLLDDINPGLSFAERLELFKKVDGDCSGSICLEEFKEFWLNWKGVTPVEVEGDGEVDNDDAIEWTDEDRRITQEAFSKYDVDHSGTITLAEFDLLLVELGLHMRKAERQQLFHFVSGGDDTFSYFDFENWWITFSERPSIFSNLDNDDMTWADHMEGALKTSFQKYDKDGGGTITFDEFALLVEEQGLRRKTKELLAMFERVDADGSGVISYEEFRDWWIVFQSTKKSAVKSKPSMTPRRKQMVKCYSPR